MQVLAFGGGLKATLTGGNISHNNASQQVLVLADSHLAISGVNFVNNSVGQGVVFGE